jgi:hypothetical protein
MNIKKTFYLVTLAVLVAVAVAGYLLVPTFSGASTVSAQESASKADGGEVATPEMLRYALDFKADDMAKSFSALNQLPCTEVSDTDLSGKSFKAGVYCLSSAQLAGQMVLDGDNDPSSIFIFKIAGSLNTKNGSSVELTNNAQAANIFFVANDVANVREGTNFRGMILAKNAVKVDEGATIEGRLLSLNSKVSAPQSAMSPQQFGTLQICKTLRAGDTTAASLLGRVFQFTVTGVAGTINIGPFTSIGQMICTGALQVPAGVQTITELNQTTNAAGGGTLPGGFQLFGVNVLSPAVPGGTTGSTIVAGQTNLSARTVGVNIVAGGGIGGQLTIELLNRAAITGFIEICKQAAATAAGGTSNVTGFFSFVVEGVFNANGVGLQVFTVPVGQCTNAIAVNIGDPGFGGTVFISELGRQGFFLTNVFTSPAGAQLGNVQLGLSINQTAGFVTGATPLVNNTGGGTVLVAINATTTNNAAGEVVVNFVNQAVALAKVCKIAGPGVAIGTQFVFQVEGTSGATATNSNAAGGFNFGNVVRAVVVPAGDPASGGNCVFVPGIGGAGVAGTTAAGLQTFLSGTPIRVFELGAVAGTGGTGTGAAGTTGGTVLNVGTAAGNGAGAQVGVNVVTTLIGGEAIRVARIRTSSTFTSTTLAGFSPNPTLTPGTRTAITTGTAPDVVTVFPATTFLGAGSVFAQAGVTEIEFVDVGFSPATLKVCKIAGTGFPLNTAVTFDVAVVSPNTTGGVPGGTTPIFGNFTVPVTVNAGPAAQGGNCVFVDPTLGTGTLLGGFFDIGSTVTITERASGTTQVTGITSSTATTSTATGGLTVNTAGRVATLSGTGGLVGGVNIVTFTNGTVAGGDVKFDFNGDGRSDISVFRPSEGTWYINNSGTENKGMTATQFGEATDKTVPADFDGDKKTDVAVFRPSNGGWYIQQSSKGGSVFSVQYGAAGDIPVPADFDGDKKADVAVFRPSTGTWYLNRSTDGSTGVQFGQAGDQPVAADFDGDGKADMAVFRPSNGIWYINQSSGGVKAIQFGIATDRAVPADYDGDGKADVAVFRNNGTWYVMGSQDGFTGVQFGQAGDIPVAANYDGDNKADMAVYRNGTWYLLQSKDGFTGVGFGMSTDTPVPASFVR